MKRVRVAAVVVAMLMLAGCSQISSGTVHDRESSPGYYSMTYCGKGCFVPVYIASSWSLDLYRSSSDHGWRDVDERTYEACSIGERYPECAQ